MSNIISRNSEGHMIDIDSWLNQFNIKITDVFKNRVEFIGIQGSYARGEANENSDIDVVLILNKLTANDLKIYDETISQLPYRNLICGFVSGKEELQNWDPTDMFQFYFDTVPIQGNLDWLSSYINCGTAKTAARIGACNIYHSCVHNIVHEKDINILKSLYKSAVFTIQALYYYKNQTYIHKKDKLMPLVDPPERTILSDGAKLITSLHVTPEEFYRLSEQLFVWAGDLINYLKI